MSKRFHSSKDTSKSTHVKLPPSANEPLVNADKEYPLFCLKCLSSSHNVNTCQSKEKAALIDRLERLSQLTWGQLRMAPKYGLGYEKIGHDSIRVSIPSHVTPDVNLIAFRFSDKAPMIGFRGADRRVFHIVWLDRNFNVYDHGS